MQITTRDIRRFIDKASSWGREVHEKRSRWVEGVDRGRSLRVSGVARQVRGMGEEAARKMIQRLLRDPTDTLRVTLNHGFLRCELSDPWGQPLGKARFSNPTLVSRDRVT